MVQAHDQPSTANREIVAGGQGAGSLPGVPASYPVRSSPDTTPQTSPVVSFSHSPASGHSLHLAGRLF